VIVGLYAEALAAVGREPEALATLDTALEMARVHKTPFMDAELSRQKAVLLLRDEQVPREDVENLLRGAMEDAHARGMKAFELRAAASLARLLLDGGQKEEARSLLGDVYNSFGEGQRSRDLHEAESLLAQLG
jgi:predicted ATPase